MNPSFHDSDQKFEVLLTLIAWFGCNKDFPRSTTACNPGGGVWITLSQF